MTEARIVCTPGTMVGKPRIDGTRLTVQLILEQLGYGHSFEDLLKDYPNLTIEGIRAALAFAGEVFARERTLPELAVPVR